MEDLASFARLIDALRPWLGHLVIVGGWAHRLHRFHPLANALKYQPLRTRDADVAFSVERAADDERYFVKKAVNMALRAIGKLNPALNAAAVIVARRLSESSEAAARWVGNDALREFTIPVVLRRLTSRRHAKG